MNVRTNDNGKNNMYDRKHFSVFTICAYLLYSKYTRNFVKKFRD